MKLFIQILAVSLAGISSATAQTIEIHNVSGIDFQSGLTGAPITLTISKTTQYGWPQQTTYTYPNQTINKNSHWVIQLENELPQINSGTLLNSISLKFFTHEAPLGITLQPNINACSSSTTRINVGSSSANCQN